jgi:hypothetical protein
MSKITVSRNELMAALLFASTDESRCTLNGVLIEGHAGVTAHPTIVATDGRRLAVIETVADQQDGDSMEEHTMLLKSEFVKPLCALSKALGGKNNPWIQFSNNPGSKQVAVAFIGSQCVVDVEDGALIDGVFPEWRMIVPSKKAKREPINDLGLNAEAVGDFAKAAKIMEASTPIVQMNLVGKEQAIEVRLYSLPQFYGIIMPCKVDDSVDYQPEFLQVAKMFPVPETAEKDPQNAPSNEGEEPPHIVAGPQ